MKQKLILVLAVALTVCLALVGCSEKTALSADAFSEAMEEEGFTVVDVSDTTEGDAEKVLVAVGDEYQIEYFSFEDEELAEAVFETNREIVEDKDFSSSSHVSKSGPNYNYFSLTGDGEFFIVAQVEDTMIYCNADKDCKEEVEELLEELGYK